MVCGKTDCAAMFDTVVLDPKWHQQNLKSSSMFLTLIERKPLKRNANLPSGENSTGNVSRSEMSNYSFCARVTVLAALCVPLL